MEITQIIDNLKQLGWSVGDVGFHNQDGPITLITCHRDKLLISVKSSDTTEAWRKALEQAVELERK